MAWYEFRLRGQVSPATLGAFGEFQASTEPAETFLSGELDDSEGLEGVLARIQDLGLELVGMRRLPLHPAHTSAAEEEQT